MSDSYLFACSIFVYPALLTIVMTTLTFPNGTGQWLGGEVSPLSPKSMVGLMCVPPSNSVVNRIP